jgi:hypothetical protein
MRTVGLSKKLVPALVGIVVGFLVCVLVDKETGLSILLTAVGALGLGYAAPADAQTPDRPR